MNEQHTDTSVLDSAGLTATERQSIERYYAVAGLAVLVSAVLVPSAGLLGAMLVATCLMMPMVLQFWDTKPAAAITMGVVGALLLGPVMYGIARVTTSVMFAAINAALN